jgi:hypothetical protein
VAKLDTSTGENKPGYWLPPSGFWENNTNLKKERKGNSLSYWCAKLYYQKKLRPESLGY